jgi:hypothetical protein
MQQLLLVDMHWRVLVFISYQLKIQRWMLMKPELWFVFWKAPFLSVNWQWNWKNSDQTKVKGPNMARGGGGKKHIKKL